MSSFYCDKCKAAIIDTPNGYVTECPHYQPGVLKMPMNEAKRATTQKLIGGLTTNQRAKFFRLIFELQQATTNCHMRINDSDRRSFRARTLAAKKMAEAARDIHRLLAKT